jgi:uncharacterized membrane protein
MVLRTIRQGGDSFVPHLAVFLGFALALASLGVLIYFIHHSAASIQAMTIIATVHEDLQATIARLFPDPYEKGKSWQPAAGEIPDDFDRRALPVRAGKSGYLQAIAVDTLMQSAVKHDLLIRFVHRPGHYVIKDSALAQVLSSGEKGDEERWSEKIREAFFLGRQRTQEQDLEFLIQELVEIAVRALSQGINDPNTAITCIDRLGSALAELAGRAIPSPFRKDQRGRLRLVSYPYTFTGLVEAAFDQIRQFGLGYVSVTIRLLETIAAVLPFTRGEEQRQALIRQAAMIDQGSAQAFPEEYDRRKIHERYLMVFEVLEREFGLTGTGG